MTDEAIAKLIAELKKHDDALERRDDAPMISNFIEVASQQGGKNQRVPRSMSDIIADVKQCTDDWPRRIDSTLFVDDPEHGLAYFDRRTAPGMFGWLRRHNEVRWAGGENYVSQAELFAEMERTATRYDAVELFPHEPPVASVYYRHAATEHGDGSHLRWLLDRFRPETTVDRVLIQAAFLTLFWGGPAGKRPMFVITSDDGRGTGKTTVAEIAGRLCGGHVSVSAGEEVSKLKERLLTPSARVKRLALLDNLKSMKFSWAELEALTTESVISGKQLYVGESQRPNLLSWFITVNGASLGPDIARRSIIIKIVKGENESAWWETTSKFIDDHRQQIINDIITLLRTNTAPPAGFSFSTWEPWEQHVLCKLPDPVAAQRVFLERQGLSNCELDEAEIVEEFFARELAQRGHAPAICQQRIPVQLAAQWYCQALNRTNEATNVVSRKLNQMANEGQLKRISKDTSNNHGRCFVWTGAAADTQGEPIKNDLVDSTRRNAHNPYRG